MKCRSHNIATTQAISSIAYRTKVNLQLIRNLNDLLYNACTKDGFRFVDNGAVAKCDFYYARQGHRSQFQKGNVKTKFCMLVDYSY